MNYVLTNFRIWLSRIGRKNGYLDYITTRQWTVEDEICLNALLALSED